ncbi:MAG: RHS repeat-associated core domain-containing protein [Roseiflexaceae bacterium]|nr:RHS repeat-associated core domain-containing protein [Roseiflexaceae bacterium]
MDVSFVLSRPSSAPALGRFISPDSIVPSASALTLAPHDAVARQAWAQRGGVPATPQELNRYAYARNNPLRWTDPTGHWIESALDIAFIAYDLYDITQHGLTWENGLAITVPLGDLDAHSVTRLGRSFLEGVSTLMT